MLPKKYIKKFKNLKFRHVQKLGRILRIILRIAIELTPSTMRRLSLHEEPAATSCLPSVEMNRSGWFSF